MAVGTVPARLELPRRAPDTGVAVLRTVNVGRKSLADYYSIVARDLMTEVRDLAGPLEGVRVLHVNATSFGGGVAEILYAAVPLMNDIGVHTDWKVMHGREDFFHVTKAMHNELQGAPGTLTAEDRATFDRYNVLNAGGLSERYDVIVVHDPQPVGLCRHAVGQDEARWVWRCHIDLSTPNPDTLAFMLPYLEGYDATVFHMARYIPDDPRVPTPLVVPPAIDPLSPKNMALSAEDAAYIVDQFGPDVERPLMLQVSRFDPWKDPLGVIDAYRATRDRVADLQLALVGSMASDDPEGWEYLTHTLDYAADDPDIYILSNLNNVGSVEVNAFQTQADVVVQKSTREGFGLTVTEALWKGRPTVAGNVGGIPLQIADGETGWLVDSVEECADRCARALADPEAARAMARRGKQHVRHDFLTPRLLRDWLVIFSRLLGRAA